MKIPLHLRLILALVILAAPLGAQSPTARDTVFAKKFHDEANRKNGPRKGTVNALADSLVMAAPAPVNRPPVALFAYPSAGCREQQPCTFTSTSTDDKAVTGFAWDCGAVPNCASTGATATMTYPHSGDRTVTLTVRDAEGLSSAQTRTIPVTAATPPPDSVIVPPQPPDSTPPIAAPAELPRSVPAFTIPPPTRTVRVPAPGIVRSILSTITFGIVDAADLQSAFDNAQPGDEILLPAGATYTGNYRLPTRPCSGWVTVRSDVPPIARGIRVDTLAARQFAKIVTPNSDRALEAASPSCQWNVVQVEIGASASAGVPNVSLNYGIVWLGNGGWLAGGENQVSLAQVPQQLVLDHVWIHGTSTTNTTRCLKLDSGNTIVRDSRLSDCHALGSDSQAILGCNGPGPFLIENNYLEGAGENVMFGGCDPAAPELIPSDITFRRNHVVKPLAWKGVWTIKNPFELKDAHRVLLEANVFENSWVAAQLGMAIVIKSSTETCGACTWEGTKDVTVRWNVFKNAHRGLNIQAIDGSSAGTTASHTERVAVDNNLFTGIGTSNGVAPSDGWLMLITHDLNNIAIRHNTFVGNTAGYGLAAYFTYSGGAARRIAIDDNVLAGQSYYALASDGGLHTSALTAFAGTSWSFQRNVVAQVDGQFVGANPSTSWYVPAVAGIGLAADGSLLPTSPFKGKGWNGTDPGADIAEIARRTTGVVVPP